MTLIEKDIANGSQIDDQKDKAVTVKDMLAAVLGTQEDKSKKESEDKTLAPEESVAAIIIPVKKPELQTVIAHAIPTPIKKPIIKAKAKVIAVIDLTVDDSTLQNLKDKTDQQDHSQSVAEISIGPVGDADSAQMASIQAMAKASSIGAALRDHFQNITIKFNPFQPFGTVKVTITEGRGNHA